MAELIEDISGTVLYFHDMAPIVISGDPGTPVDVSLSSNDMGLLLEESYYPDFNGEVAIDIRDVIASCFSITLPEIDTDTPQPKLYDMFSLTFDEHTVTFTVCGFSQEIINRISDIDILNIPSDYRLPLSLCNNSNRSGITYRFSDGTSETEGGLLTDISIGVVSRMIDISCSPASGRKSFYVELACEGVIITTPVFHIMPGHFEQYLFANRYGGFDNIPMAGVREYVPDMTFENGVFNDTNEPISSDAEYIYSQNSGFVSKAIMELAPEFLCSGQIYHLDGNGEFRKIVIVETSLTSRSDECLHEFSFRYKYADDSRPATVRPLGLSMQTVAAVKQKTLVYPIEVSPMTINHNLGRYPSVTVVDTDKQVVLTQVEYPDSNSVIISWLGELEGYVYIN